jgi:FkbM family methyltransferase
VNIKQAIKRIIFKDNSHLFEYVNISYSQEGEDLVLDRLFESKPNGFYIDVGAHHPKRFSNTFKFYCKGWSGINIDAMPGSMNIFKEIRPRDINLEIPVSKEVESLTYFIFNEPALNTLNEKEADLKSKIPGYHIIEKKVLQTKPLSMILDEHLGNEKKPIDFMSIDVEGLDMQVLQSNNWNKYRPTYVLAEDLRVNNNNGICGQQLLDYMASIQYQLIGRTVNTVFFKNILAKYD